MSAFKGYGELRAARNDAKLLGIRLKKSKDAKDEPASKADE